MRKHWFWGRIIVIIWAFCFEIDLACHNIWTYFWAPREITLRGCASQAKYFRKLLGAHVSKWLRRRWLRFDLKKVRFGGVLSIMNRFMSFESIDAKISPPWVDSPQPIQALESASGSWSQLKLKRVSTDSCVERVLLARMVHAYTTTLHIHTVKRTLLLLSSYYTNYHIPI